MNSAGTIRKYVLQTLKEVKHGFVDEVDLPIFYDNVDDIDVLFENDLTAKNELSGWMPFIDRLRVDALKYKGEASADFLLDYLFTHLDSIVERINEHYIVEKRIDITGDKLSHNQIALIYVYEGWQVTRDNGGKIAKEYGHTSGEKLFQRFTHYSSNSNRKGKEETQKKTENKIKLIESIIPLLSQEKEGKAIDEIQILKSYSEIEY